MLLDKSSMYEFNIEKFDNIINELREWYKKAIFLYNSQNKIDKTL